ncbi:MAG: biosynthetic-type acetolactate synthase large subunit [Mariprofundales bacterium]
MKLSGAQIFVECLQREGVDVIFGYPGGAVLPIYDEIFKSQAFQHVLVRHEQAALHAANGYARVSERCGVALVTSGPGATNAVTGLADSLADSIPTVCFSGQVASNLIGNDAFQEADTVGITRSATKHNFLVKDVKDLAKVIRQAFHIATTGRPGPVLVDIPKDISIDQCVFNYPDSIDIRSYKPKVDGHSKAIKKALDTILAGQQPIFYAGGGVCSAGAAQELTQLTNLLNIPVTNTLMGLGGIACDNPHYLGMLGMHGTYEANHAIMAADVIVAIGARFDDRVTGKLDTFGVKAKIIHIDIDPSCISKNVVANQPIVGDIRNILQKMLQILAKNTSESLSVENRKRTSWWQQINNWRAVRCLDITQQPESELLPQYVIQRLHALTNGDAIIATDVGQHQMWSAQYYGFKKPNHWLTSGGLGTMGYGLPAACGAQMYVKQSNSDTQVFVITGDGSIQMNIQELSTAIQHDLPIKIVLLNNGYLGMVRQWQEMFYDKRYSHSYMDSLPDFVKLAEAYGGVGMRITKPVDVDAAIKKSMQVTDKFVFLEFIVHGQENVYPMVPSNAPLTDMKLSPEATARANAINSTSSTNNGGLS